MQGLFLVSPWKPILMILPFIGWAWVVSTIYDKDAARWYFKRRAWNIAHLLVAVAALAAMALSPNFWIGWPVMTLLLMADLAVYAVQVVGAFGVVAAVSGAVTGPSSISNTRSTRF